MRHATVLMPRCALCLRPVEAVRIWKLCADDLPNVIYFHGDGERCFVANHDVAPIVAHIREIDPPGENIPDQ